MVLIMADATYNKAFNKSRIKFSQPCGRVSATSRMDRAGRANELLKTIARMRTPT